MQNTQKEILSYIDTVLTIFLGIVFFLFPLLFLTPFTDVFAVPKQTLLLAGIALSLLFLGVRMIIIRRVQLRSTPFDLPVVIFVIATFLSAVFAVNRYDSLINFMPLLFAVLLFFIIVNVLKGEKVILFAIAALVAGASLAGVVTALSYFKIYIFPSPDTQSQSFSTLGSLLDQAIYLAIVIPFGGYIAWPFLTKILGGKKRVSSTESVPVDSKSLMGFGIGFTIASLVLLVGLGMSLYLLFTIAKPIILPLETGFQTAFASISQDTGRVLQGFLLGSGYGTYLTDFSRFKQASYNLNPQLWSFSFFRSSSFVLELIATTGALGLFGFLFIGYRFLKEKTLFLPLVLLFIASFVLPFSYVLQVLFFIVLGLFAATQALSHPRRYEDLEFYFVALKKGLLAAVPESHSQKADATTYSRILPFLAMLVIILFVGMISYLSGRYVLSDIALKNALNAAVKNNGLQTYNYLRDAISLFPYRDTNYRIFSQTNLALANSLAVSQPSGQKVTEETQQTILTLIQQAINAGRNAVTISPQTALNWNNLSGIYRSMIGFGQNADQFAIITNQEAIRLDATNPQEYINLGGIYYQLQQWDQAQNQFQIAIQLKPDFANAYYNLGHALESKGDLQGALAQYQAVKTLVQNDAANLKRIDEEITALQEKIGSQQQTNANTTTTLPSENQPPLNINKPETQLPERKPPVKIEGPTTSPTPAEDKTTPSPSPEATTPTPTTQ